MSQAVGVSEVDSVISFQNSMNALVAHTRSQIAVWGSRHDWGASVLHPRMCHTKQP